MDMAETNPTIYKSIMNAIIQGNKMKPIIKVTEPQRIKAIDIPSIKDANPEGEICLDGRRDNKEEEEEEKETVEELDRSCGGVEGGSENGRGGADRRRARTREESS